MNESINPYEVPENEPGSPISRGYACHYLFTATTALITVTVLFVKKNGDEILEFLQAGDFYVGLVLLVLPLIYACFAIWRLGNQKIEHGILRFFLAFVGLPTYAIVLRAALRFSMFIGIN